MKPNLILTVVVGLAGIPLTPLSNGQVFGIDEQNGRLFANGQRRGSLVVTGSATVDAGANTVALNAAIAAPAAAWTEQFSREVLVPGAFPNFAVYTETLSISYSIDSWNQALSMDPVIPDSIGGTLYHASLPSAPFDVVVNFSYSLGENGTEVDAGIGSYTTRGQSHGVVFDVAAYPADLRILIQSAILSPTGSDAVINVLPPHGDRFVVYPQTLRLNVPEPETWAVWCGVGLLGFAAVRRRPACGGT